MTSERYDARSYIDEIVGPTIKDFEQNPTSRRHAFLACVAVFHTIDYIAYPKSSANQRKKFGSESTDFKLVDHVAHAFKHVQNGKPQGTTNTDIISRPPAFWNQMMWDLSRWDDPTGGVTLNTDRDVDLLDAVKRASSFLHNKI